jgi:hypothetical protein
MKSRIKLSVRRQDAAASSYKWKDEDSPDFGEADHVSASGGGGAESRPGPAAAAAKTPRGEDGDGDWSRFQQLTAGFDKVLKEKQEKLAEIKVDSYYQRKKTQVACRKLVLLVLEDLFLYSS